MIYYVEIGVKYTNAYGDISEPFYASMERMYEKTAEYLSNFEFKYEFAPRFEKIVKDTSGIGWGFHDNLQDMFSLFFPRIK